MEKIELVLAVGNRMRAMFDALAEGKRGTWCETSQELAAQISNIIDAGDVVLVKGSLGSKMALIVDAIRKLGHPDSR